MLFGCNGSQISDSFFFKYGLFDARLMSNGSSVTFNNINCSLEVIEVGLCAVVLPLLAGVELCHGFVQSLWEVFLALKIEINVFNGL